MLKVARSLSLSSTGASLPKLQLFLIPFQRSFIASKTIKKMPIKAALIDLSGTMHVEDDPTPNAIEALKRLRKTGIHIKFVTNTTKESGETLYNRLAKMGFELDKQEIYSSLSATANYVKTKNLNPFYLVSADARKDFPPESSQNYDAVVVGLAPNEFHYENMNKAFRILMDNKNSQLIAVHQGKYYKRGDGLALGPGCFVKGLEYAASVNAILIGKPNQYFFESAIPDGVKADECVMIGDDPNDDCKGSLAVGMKAILVKTGKYLPDIVVDPPPTLLAENFAEAVQWIEQNK
ncbi:haloacid dehalogenase-like hydrolase domain-containing protein 2 [Episyrphus balteatus]|uniref:haloacid dehalogenase-like hydrolase domain-containing protein 2 n=1 Tax=Episyrphus balteatus TaxID=286459 RepID=UPI0024869F0F|nr:haloacid dehalogenase-like hydrolase domain-containing protein 2 [Episyrphus balteatus]